MVDKNAIFIERRLIVAEDCQNQRIPFFSIIIPLYNKEDTVERALDSINNQSFKNYEVIVINDGSTDSSVSVAKSYNSINLIIIEQNNQGVSTARNNGVNAAKARFVAFIDADDEWKPEYLQEMYELIKRYPDAAVYGADFETVLLGGCAIGGKDRRVRRKCNLFKEWIVRPPFHASGLIVKKKAFESVRGFDPNDKYGEDYALIFKLALRYPVAVSERVLTRYHSDANESATSAMAQSGSCIFAHHRMIEEVLADSRWTSNRDLRKYALFAARSALASRYYKGDYRAVEQFCRILPNMSGLVLEKNLYSYKWLRLAGCVVSWMFIIVSSVRVKMKLKLSFSAELRKIITRAKALFSR